MIQWLLWRLDEFRWWWTWTIPARDAKIRFIQEMEWSNPTDEEWGTFLNSLTVNEFLALMCLDKPAEPRDEEEEYPDEEDDNPECEELVGEEGIEPSTSTMST